MTSHNALQEFMKSLILSDHHGPEDISMSEHQSIITVVDDNAKIFPSRKSHSRRRRSRRSQSLPTSVLDKEELAIQESARLLFPIFGEEDYPHGPVDQEERGIEHEQQRQHDRCRWESFASCSKNNAYSSCIDNRWEIRRCNQTKNLQFHPTKSQDQYVSRSSSSTIGTSTRSKGDCLPLPVRRSSSDGILVDVRHAAGDASSPTTRIRRKHFTRSVLPSTFRSMPM